MCGIAGFYDPLLSASQSDSVIKLMLGRISHRGPDFSGQWISQPLVFGHNRLSIIDLSADGNQPMHFFDSAIVFNGEIYNYIELKQELTKKGYDFKTHSDTEVVLAAWREYGERCVDFFVGMWSFALWDKKENCLFCSRDRFGIKPFYYIQEGERFYFASEYKALKESPLFRNDVNWDQVNRGLQMGWNAYGDETYFTSIHSLNGAHNLLFKDGTINVYQYWDIGKTPLNTSSFEEQSFNFRKLFLDSIQLHMRSDVEVGGCLSGGLDSSSIASVVGELYPESRFKTFTIFYEGEGTVDERPWVNEVLKKYPQFAPSYYQPTDTEVADHFDHMLYHADVPIAGSSPISQYFVMKLAAEHKVKVLLDGQGSDEYLGGYLHSFYRLIGGQLRNLKFGAFFQQLNRYSEVQNLSLKKKSSVFLKSLLASSMSEQQLYSMEYNHYFPKVSEGSHSPFRLENKFNTPLKSFLYNLVFSTSLPSLLQFEDRNSMAFSIESRVPFLDHRLVEYAFTLPDSSLINDGITKKILRTGLKNELPAAISERMDKKGFVTPGEVKWLRGSLSFLLESDFKNLDHLNIKLIQNLVTQFKQGDNKNANLVWRLAVLNYWLKKNA